MTNFDDDALSRALQGLPARAHPPLERIRQRARILRARRRGAGATVSVMAAAAIAAPVVITLSGSDSGSGYAAPPDTATRAACDELEGSIDPDVAEPLAVGQVPAGIRLLWSDSVGERPVGARAENHYEHFDEVYPNPCEPEVAERAPALIVDVEDDVVSRTIDLTASTGEMAPPQSYSEHTFSLEVGPVDVSVFRPEFPDGDAKRQDEPDTDDFFQAWWTGTDGTHWWLRSQQRDVTDAELRDLVESGTMKDGRVDLVGSSVARDAALVADLGDSGEPYADLPTYEVGGDSLLLTVEMGDEVGLVTWASLGDGYLAEGVAGGPTFLFSHPDGSAAVRWQPEPGILADLRSSNTEYDVDELLEIARSVEPTSAEDQRLTGVWGNCPSPEHSSSLLSPCDSAT